MYTQELYHHGTKGQKWGIRKYQNADGSLTPEGKRRYGYGTKKYSVRENSGHQKFGNDAMKTEEKLNKRYEKATKKGDAEKIKQAKNDIKTFKVNKNKAAKVLGMSANEVEYRDVEASYNRRIKRAALGGAAVGGVFGAVAGPVVSNFTSTGRAYYNAYRDANEKYQAEKGSNTRRLV